RPALPGGGPDDRTPAGHHRRHSHLTGGTAHRHHDRPVHPDPISDRALASGPLIRFGSLSDVGQSGNAEGPRGNNPRTLQNKQASPQDYRPKTPHKKHERAPT